MFIVLCGSVYVCLQFCVAVFMCVYSSVGQCLCMFIALRGSVYVRCVYVRCVYCACLCVFVSLLSVYFVDGYALLNE